MTCMESAKEVGEDTDVIVIGAGPAGMSAAVELSESGLGVVVLDMQPSPGGQIFRALEENTRALPTTGPLSRMRAALRGRTGWRLRMAWCSCRY